MQEITFTKTTITFLIQKLMGIVDALEPEKEYILTIKKKTKKRSLDANAYYWTLLDKLSERMKLPKEEIYKRHIKNIGGVSEIVCVKNEAVESLIRAWSFNGIGWQTDTTESKIKGCTNVILYAGSSTYNSSQMSSLINLCIEDCRAVGIETMTPREIEKLIEMQGRK